MKTINVISEGETKNGYGDKIYVTEFELLYSYYDIEWNIVFKKDLSRDIINEIIKQSNPLNLEVSNENDSYIFLKIPNQEYPKPSMKVILETKKIYSEFGVIYTFYTQIPIIQILESINCDLADLETIDI